MNRGAGRLRIEMRVAFDAAGLGRELLVAYHVAEPSRVVAAPKVMKPRRIVDAVAELEEEVEILGAQVQLLLGTPKVEAAVSGISPSAYLRWCLRRSPRGGAIWNRNGGEFSPRLHASASPGSSVVGSRPAG